MGYIEGLGHTEYDTGVYGVNAVFSGTVVFFYVAINLIESVRILAVKMRAI